MDDKKILDIVGILLFNSYRNPEQVLTRKRRIRNEKMIYDTIGGTVPESLEKIPPVLRSIACGYLKEQIDVYLNANSLKEFSTFENYERKIPLRTTTFIPLTPIPNLRIHEKDNYHILNLGELPHSSIDTYSDGVLVSGSLIFVSNIYPDGGLKNYIHGNILSENPHPFRRGKGIPTSSRTSL